MGQHVALSGSQFPRLESSVSAGTGKPQGGQRLGLRSQPCHCWLGDLGHRTSSLPASVPPFVKLGTMIVPPSQDSQEEITGRIRVE